MQIFLQILAIIGIVLLCIIGLILLLLGLVLFVPVRYKVRGTIENQVPEVKVYATWLLHLLSVKFYYPQPGEVVLRVFGWKVWSMKPGADKDKDAEKDAAPEEEKVAEGPSKEPQETVAEGETKEVTKEAPDEVLKETFKETPEDSNKETPDKQGFFEKIRCKIKELCDKIKNVAENYRYYRDLLQKKENYLLFGRFQTYLFKVLKSIRPRVLRADLVVGTGEPDSTGYLLGVIGALYPFLGDHVNIIPNFEEKMIEGNFFAKGKVTLFTLAYYVARVYFDDQLHVFIGSLKRKEE